MRLVTLALLVLLVAGGAGAYDSVTKAFIGATTRDPIFGPVISCDVANATSVGGACFASPWSRGYVTIIVHADNVPDWVHVPIMIYGYANDIAPIPRDGEVECPPNHGAVRFWFQQTTTHIAVAVGPWEGPGITCAGVPGVSGTIDMIPIRPFIGDG